MNNEAHVVNGKIIDAQTIVKMLAQLHFKRFQMIILTFIVIIKKLQISVLKNIHYLQQWVYFYLILLVTFGK